jgi:hypothetical protein
MSDPDLPGYFPEPIRLPEPPGGFAPSPQPEPPRRRRRRPADGPRAGWRSAASLTRAGVIIMALTLLVIVVLVVLIAVQHH